MFSVQLLRPGGLRWVLLVALVLPAASSPLDRALQVAQASRLKPGYGICLFDGHGEIWSSYEGHANEETGSRFSRDTVFRVGAISDIFTVMMALQQVDAGRMDPEDPVASYLPDLFSEAPRDSPLEIIGRLKIRTLMSHLSGTDANFFLNHIGYDPLVNLRPYLETTRLKYPPRTKFLRSGAMIDLLGLAVEQVCGERFEDSANATLFEPLGMTASSFRDRESPLSASLHYKSAAQDSYATRLPGFRDVVAPSGSMLSSLKDMTAFYAALLRMPAQTSERLLSPTSFNAMFSSQSDVAMHRQGLRIGYAWKLSLPELSYLGRVAWSSGKYLSHRNVVILLTDQGIGVACATNAWSIFEQETILPLGILVLKAYAREFLNLPEPVQANPARVPLPAKLKAQVGGLYASPYGIHRIRPGTRALLVSSSTSALRFDYCGDGTFLAPPNEAIDTLTFDPPDALHLSMKDGVAMEARRVHPAPGDPAWLRRRGTYRVEGPQAGALFAFTLGSFSGLPTITGDDGPEQLLESRSATRASVRCDESSRFFGLEIVALGAGRVRLGAVSYRRSP